MKMRQRLRSWPRLWTLLKPRPPILVRTNTVRTILTVRLSIPTGQRGLQGKTKPKMDNIRLIPDVFKLSPSITNPNLYAKLCVNKHLGNHVDRSPTYESTTFTQLGYVFFTGVSLPGRSSEPAPQPGATVQSPPNPAISQITITLQPQVPLLGPNTITTLSSRDYLSNMRKKRHYLIATNPYSNHIPISTPKT